MSLRCHHDRCSNEARYNFVSIGDDYEVLGDKLDQLVDLAMQIDGVYGSHNYLFFSFRDDYEVSCDELDQLVDLAMQVDSARVVYNYLFFSFRDEYEVLCDELDQLVDLSMQVDGVCGSRITICSFLTEMTMRYRVMSLISLLTWPCR